MPPPGDCLGAARVRVPAGIFTSGCWEALAEDSGNRHPPVTTSTRMICRSNEPHEYSTHFSRVAAANA